jgi:hypothetical protein
MAANAASFAIGKTSIAALRAVYLDGRRELFFASAAEISSELKCQLRINSGLG